jgi:hypothetical protein
LLRARDFLLPTRRREIFLQLLLLASRVPLFCFPRTRAIILGIGISPDAARSMNNLCRTCAQAHKNAAAFLFGDSLSVPIKEQFISAGGEIWRKKFKG